MPNTAEGFYYPDASTNIAPLETVLANMAASSDAVSKQTPRVFANYAAMIAAIPAPTAGRLAVTTQGNGILWQYDGTAAKWVVQNTPTFTDTATRDAAIPNPTAGIKCVIGSGATYAEYVWTGAAWRSVDGPAYAPVEAVQPWNSSPAATPDDIGMTVTVGCPGPAAVWEVTVTLDAEVVANGVAVLVASLVAGGVPREGELIATPPSSGMLGYRLPMTRTWLVTGLAAGAQQIKPRASQASAIWMINATHSRMLVRQVR